MNSLSLIKSSSKDFTTSKSNLDEIQLTPVQLVSEVPIQTKELDQMNATMGAIAISNIKESTETMENP